MHLLEEILDNLLEFPPMNSQNFGYAIWYNKYKEQNIITQLLAEFYTPNVLPPSTHNQNLGNRVPQTFENNSLTNRGSTLELPPLYWVTSGLSHH
jgi:hypothetical protein